MKNSEIPRDLVYKFFRNQCTVQEHEKIMRWMKSASATDISDLLEQHIDVIRDGDIEYNVETRLTFEQVERKINVKKRSEQHKLIIRRFMQMAAAILLVMATYYTLEFVSTKPDEVKPAITKATIIESRSAYGEQANLKLSDGTQVKLNAGTELSYPTDFSPVRRELTLHGQAFFEVARDTSRPFVINTGNLQVTVLGTIFDVKSFSEDNLSLVTVLKGKVKVRIKSTDNVIVLTPNEQIIFDSRNNSYKKQVIDAKKSIAWINRILRFDRTPLIDVFKQMERWYNVKIIVPDSLNLNCTVSGQHKNEGLRSVLEALQYSHGLKFQYINGNVLIKGVSCK